MRGDKCSPDEAQRNPGPPVPHSVSLHAGYGAEDADGRVKPGHDEVVKFVPERKILIVVF
jgi:hypothetical protein